MQASSKLSKLGHLPLNPFSLSCGVRCIQQSALVLYIFGELASGFVVRDIVSPCRVGAQGHIFVIVDSFSFASLEVVNCLFVFFCFTITSHRVHLLELKDNHTP